MKSFVLAAGLATLVAGAAAAQTTTPAAPATTTTTAPMTAASPMAANTGGAFYTMPDAAGGQMSHLASDLEDKDVYGANDEKIGEIEDFVINSDGTVAAAVVEVGGFLGVGQKDVLVNFGSLQMTMNGNDMRVMAPELSKESLTSAQGVDLDAVFPDRD